MLIILLDELSNDLMCKNRSFVYSFIHCSCELIFFRSLRKAVEYLLNENKLDFYEPPRYSTLVYLTKNLPARELQDQCCRLLEQFRHDEDQSQSTVDQTTLLSENDSLYNQRGFDYIAPWNFLDIPSTTVAEQLTIVDAVSIAQDILNNNNCE
jgi:hypothetical protein